MPDQPHPDEPKRHEFRVNCLGFVVTVRTKLTAKDRRLLAFVRRMFRLTVWYWLIVAAILVGLWLANHT